MRFLILLFCFFSGMMFLVLSQEGDEKIKKAIALYHEADSCYNEALQLSDKKKSNEKSERSLNQKALEKFAAFFKTVPPNATLLDSFSFAGALKAGELAHYFDSFPQALQYYNLAIRLKKRMPVLSDTFLFKPYIFAGIIYYNQNKLDSAINYLKKAEDIQSKVSQPLEESERIYNILGNIYFEYGNFKQAKNYFQKAADLLSTNNPSYKALYVNYKMNLATTLFKLENYDEAYAIYQNLLSKSKIYANQIYNNIGLIHLYLGAPKQAIRYFKKVHYSNQLSIGLNNDMANAYLSLEAFDSAKKYLQLATERNKFYNSSNLSIDYGSTLKISGDLEKENNHFLQALRYYQQALHHFYPSFNDSVLQINPVKFTGAFSSINLFQTLVAKAETMQLLYEQTRRMEWSKQSLDAYKAAFKLVEYIERTYESDEARLFLGKIKYAVHSKPIDIAYQLYRQTNNKKYIDDLYFFDQQSKATTLALSRQISNELAATHSPLLQKEQAIKSNITRYSIRAAQITDSAQLASLNQTIRDNEIELSKIQEQLNQQGTIQQSNVPSIEWLQHSLLDESTVLISYHLSEDKITTLFITKKETNCFQQNLPANFYEAMDSFLTALKNPSGRLIDLRKTNYYSLLFDHIPLQNAKQLIIIPDDILNYLPFESLQNNEGRYLIEQVAVQYQYATALLQKEETSFAGAAVLSFAPFTQSSASDTLSQLLHSKQEIEALKGKQFFDSAATKTNFLQNCSAYKIVHLATHAVVNNTTENLSYIAFAPSQPDHLLYEQEIYNLPLRNTNLVILSACETSAGALVKGEGVMSLSRAFTYAGCSNIITTLWQANDFSTAYLTTRIHHYLAKSFSIAKAVQQAKLDYLKDKTIHPRLKQPYYWSQLIFIGNFHPEPDAQWGWFVAAGVVATFILFILVKKSRKAGPSLFKG